MITDFQAVSQILDGKESGYFNMDCMEGMKAFPDNFFDLAIVDPPYGDGGGGAGFSNGERFGQRFDKYRGGAENRLPREAIQHGADITLSDCERRTRITRTGGTWAAKFSKKLSRGTLRRGKNILTSFSASHGTR